MPTTTEQPRRIGVALLWPAASLAMMSEVDEEDAWLAMLLWLRLASEASKPLVYARPLNQPSSVFGGIARQQSRYAWSQNRLEYVSANGPVSASAVKQAVNTFAREAADELAGLTRQMNAGQMTLAEWQTAMAQQVKSVHVAVEIVAQGGIAQINAADVKRIAKGIDFQLDRLLKFSESLDDLSSFRVRVPDDVDIKEAGVGGADIPTVEPEPAISDAAAVARAKLYAETAKSTFEASVAASWGELDAKGVIVQMRNILADDADHCLPTATTPGCVQEAARGWVRYGTMSLPSRRTCGLGCLCRIAYRRKPKPPENNN